MFPLKPEDAFYYKNLLILGFSDGYDEWINFYLESENPLSDIVLELSCCDSNIDKTISLLHNYCAEQSFDEASVCDRLRLFFKDAYYSNKMAKEEIITAFYRLALNIGDPGDFDIDLWGSMFYLDYYYSLAKEGIISWKSFDSAFFAYLDNGTPLNSNHIWNKNVETKTSFLNRIKNIFNKK